tara:strand:+ start:561 stop:2252 length:1692 start_codon:yes stop_codon:yes gene_type:complete
MFLNENEIRKIIRKRLMMEAPAAAAASGTPGTATPAPGGGSSAAPAAPTLPNDLNTAVNSTSIKDLLTAFANPTLETVITGFLGGLNVRPSDVSLFPADGANSLNSLSVAIQDATTSYLTFGMGTDEEELEELVFAPIGAKMKDNAFSLYDFARLSKYYYDNIAAIKQSSTITAQMGMYDMDEDDRNLQTLLFDVRKGELNAGDLQTYVVNPFVTAAGMTDVTEFPVYVIKSSASVNSSDEDIVVTVKDLLDGNFLGSASASAGGGGTTPSTLIDIDALSGSDVEKIQFIMNKYSQNNSLGTTITVDGRWGPRTDALWNLFLNHVFANHSVFSAHSSAGTFSSGSHQWRAVSSALSGTYAAYTPNVKGCLAFVADGYNNNVEYGDGTKTFTSVPSARRGGGGSGGSGRRSSGGGDEQSASAARSQSDFSGDRGSAPLPKIRVRQSGGRNTLEDLGFPSGTTSKLAAAVRDRIKIGRTSGGVINLFVTIDRNGSVTRVGRARGQSRDFRRSVEALPNIIKGELRTLGKADTDVMQSITPGRARAVVRSKARRIELVVEIPAGTY